MTPLDVCRLIVKEQMTHHARPMFDRPNEYIATPFGSEMTIGKGWSTIGLFEASCVVLVYGATNDEKLRARMAALPLKRMVALAVGVVHDLRV